MADEVEKITLIELGVEQIELLEIGGAVTIKNTLGTVIDTAQGGDYIINDVPINVLDEDDEELGSDEYVYGTDKVLNLANYSDAMVHIGPTPPEDTDKIWIEKNI